MPYSARPFTFNAWNDSEAFQICDKIKDIKGNDLKALHPKIHTTDRQWRTVYCWRWLGFSRFSCQPERLEISRPTSQADPDTHTHKYAKWIDPNWFEYVWIDEAKHDTKCALTKLPLLPWQQLLDSLELWQTIPSSSRLVTTCWRLLSSTWRNSRRTLLWLFSTMGEVRSFEREGYSIYSDCILFPNPWSKWPVLNFSELHVFVSN